LRTRPTSSRSPASRATNGGRTGPAPASRPAEYFRDYAPGREAVKIPDPLLAPSRDGRTDPLTIERAFAAVNPGLRPDMMAVTCRRGALEEVRICFTRDLRGFRPCPEVDRNACRFGRVQVTAPR
jgi:ribonuclease T2